MGSLLAWTCSQVSRELDSVRPAPSLLTLLSFVLAEYTINKAPLVKGLLELLAGCHPMSSSGRLALAREMAELSLQQSAGEEGSLAVCENLDCRGATLLVALRLIREHVLLSLASEGL